MTTQNRQKSNAKKLNLKQMKSLIDKLLFYFYEQVSGAEVSDVCFRQFQTSINKSSALLCLNVCVTVYTIHYVGHTGIIQYVIVRDSVKKRSSDTRECVMCQSTGSSDFS